MFDPVLASFVFLLKNYSLFCSLKNKPHQTQNLLGCTTFSGVVRGINLTMLGFQGQWPSNCDVSLIHTDQPQIIIVWKRWQWISLGSFCPSSLIRLKSGYFMEARPTPSCFLSSFCFVYSSLSCWRRLLPCTNV